MPKDSIKYPVTVPVTVISTADDASVIPLKFNVTEREGVTILKWKEGGTSTPIKNKEDLQAGMIVLVPSLLGGYHKMTVQEDSDEGLFAVEGDLKACLEFSGDNRQEWIASCLVNLRAFRKVCTQPA